MNRKTLKRGLGKRCIEAKDFHLAEEIRYIRRRAAEHTGRFVTIGPVALFSTDTGDAWLLDAEDHLAARLARDGEPEDLHFEESRATSSFTSTTIPAVSSPSSLSRRPDCRVGVIGKS